MSRKLAAIVLAALVLAGCSSVADAQVVRDSKVRMDVDRVANGIPISPDLTMYSRSDTLSLVTSVTSVTVDTIGLVGPVAWLVLEWDDQDYTTNLWFQAKELEDGARDMADTLQSYAWGSWACIFVNGEPSPVGGVPLNSCGLIDSIRFKCNGSAADTLHLNLRQELIAPTWRASDAAAN